MSATETSIQDTFNEYFTETSTCVDFEFFDLKDDRKLSFIREDIPEECVRCYHRIQGYLHFDEAIYKYSKWGNSSITFALSINDSEVCRFTYSPQEIILPNLLVNLTTNEKIVTDRGVYVAKTKSKQIIRDIDSHMSNVVKSEFASYF